MPAPVDYHSKMVVQVHKIGDEFVLPLQAVRELGLVDGSVIEISRSEIVPTPTPPIRYASVEEAMEIHLKMEPRHAEAYRELSK